jgi:UDP-glucose 4-epimerase
MPLRQNSRRVLITGGAGFIGSHLTERLLATGDRVRILDNLTTGRPENLVTLEHDSNLEVVAGDVTDSDLVERLVAESDVVFHLAAAVGVKLILADAIGSFRTNVIGTENICAACARHNTKVLIASTSEVYGKVVKLPQREDDDVLLGSTGVSRWSYAAQKMLDEFVALAYHRQGLPVVIFRLFNTVGPRQTGRYGMVVPRFVDAAVDGRPIEVYGDGKQSRCFLHVHDAVEALVRLSENDDAIGHVFNVGSTEAVTILALAKRVIAATGGDVSSAAIKSAIRYVSYADAYPTGGYEDIRARVPDTRKIRSVTRWRPRHSLDKILADVVAERRLATELATGGDLAAAVA